ncbi:MAG: hypothetical protein PWP28_2196 [Oceanotoga sp.]|jgi:ribonuclease BN (tRNA processing enzyme)|uniref:MBL fold metallo-hydrolase n=1 Tax=Oceanotoga sp. TaxID=2108366 RepID=UPI00264B7F82|nr:MBL fold metallo-hydrolase [Oceanotoga sp.]MDN5343321.1 hypothetical protein [Oceanotoga sp.]
MKLTIVGRWGAYPEKDEPCSGYLLETKNNKILIDCGPGVLTNVQRYCSLDEIDYVIISHFHPDHFTDIYSFQYASMISMKLAKRRTPLKIISPLKDNKSKEMKYGEFTESILYDEGSILSLNDVEIRFSLNEHPILCYSIGVHHENKYFAYSADTQIGHNLIEFVEKADLFLCESSLYENMEKEIKGHLTARQAGNIAHSANVKKMILTHLPHFGDHEDLLNQAKKEFIGDLYLANCGDVYYI